MTEPRSRYVAWSDCTFHDYVDIFHDRNKFRETDLDRIEQAEAAWLKRADRVLFSTRWAADRAIAAYGLNPSRVETTGIFGEVALPDDDHYAGAKEFGFIATNFAAKGGHAVLAAFRRLREKRPDVVLSIIGERPADVRDEPGISFLGFLRKEVPNEYQTYCQALGRMRSLVHPTLSDIAPLVVVEADYYGCPVIASRRFGIPELVEHERTGLLLDDPSDPAAIANAMMWMLEDEGRYREMRRATWLAARQRHSKQHYSDRLCAIIRAACSAAAVR